MPAQSDRPRAPRYSDIFRENAEKEAVAKRVWHETIDWLEENALLTVRRVEVADRYARSYAEYEFLYPIASSEQPVKAGPNGGEFVNLNWSMLEKLNDRLMKFEDALLISPKAAQDKISERPPEAPKTKADAYLDD